MNKTEATVEALRNYLAGIQSYEDMDTLKTFYDNVEDCLKVRKAMDEIATQMESRIQRLERKLEGGINHARLSHLPKRDLNN